MSREAKKKNIEFNKEMIGDLAENIADSISANLEYSDLSQNEEEDWIEEIRLQIQDMQYHLNQWEILIAGDSDG